MKVSASLSNEAAGVGDLLVWAAVKAVGEPLAFFLWTDSPRSKLGAKSNWRAGSRSLILRRSLGRVDSSSELAVALLACCDLSSSSARSDGW